MCTHVADASGERLRGLVGALPRLILITDRQRAALPLIDAVTAALSALPDGAAMVLLREKDLPVRELVALARRLRPVTRSHRALLIVSGRLDVAIAAEADGVHLGSEAPACDDVRPIAPSGFVVGVSLHGDERAPASATYALISPIFPTESKPGARSLGVEGLARSRAQNPAVPLYALGGLNESARIAECFDAGAYGVAMLGAVLTSPDPGAPAQHLYEAIHQ